MLLIIPSKEHDTPNNNHEFCYVIFSIQKVI